MAKDRTIHLRAATVDDLTLLEFWDQQAHVIASDPNDDWNWAVELQRNPEWREQLIAEINGESIACIQIIDPQLEDTHYWGEIEAGFRAIDIWIGEEKNLGKGYGTEIMKQIIDRCFAETSVEAILIDPLASNTKAHVFYERLGFEFLEKRRFNEDVCHVYQLTRNNYMQL